MSSTFITTLPDTRICDEARKSRDARFDGLFFTAVTSTHIYCRPVCPAPSPKPQNIRYYASAAAAEAAGFRPCLRCRPELAPGNAVWHRGEHVVARALKLIDGGMLADHSLEQLSACVNIGARQLRRLFVEHLGAPPMDVHTTRRLLFAKQLLTETAMPVTEVALASGFGSLRRFNAAFAQANRMPPRELRRRPRELADDALVLRLGYRPPYDFEAILAFLRGRSLPGVEAVNEHSYMRVVGAAGAPGWLRLTAWPGGEHALKLELHGLPPEQLLPVVTRLRRVFDLDADPQVIAATLGVRGVLKPLLRKRPGLRLPGGWDGFECAVRAVLGQQVSVAAARTLATRIAHRYGEALAAPPVPGLDRLFPTPAQLADADLREVGVTTARAATIRGIAQAMLDGRVDFRAEQSLDEFVERWVALPGIGEWTAHYMAMRALSHPDAFPAADLILRRVAAGAASELSTKALTELAEAWRPWRAYAVMHLWRSAGDAVPIKRNKSMSEDTVHYDHMPTPIGQLLLAADAQGLREVWFETSRHPKMLPATWRHSPQALQFARVQMDEYFAGTRQHFELPLHPLGTPFQLAVWRELGRIPYGVTISYGELARRIEQPQAVRAVGAANGRNPLPIVLPCHRVIGSDGSLTGFGGGLPTKRFLLAMEDQIARGDLFNS